MSDMREYFEMREKAFGENFFTKFMLAHGQDYPIGPDTFAGPRQKAKECYSNAARAAVWNKSLTYVEGMVACHGVPIAHAWLVDKDGFVVDPTLTNDDGRISDYFGVPFRTDYLKRAVVANKVYGLLDFFYAGQTAPKLFELGLEAGQQWLLDNPIPAKKRQRRAA